jgi:hypothetical protein
VRIPTWWGVAVAVFMAGCGAASSGATALDARAAAAMRPLDYRLTSARLDACSLRPDGHAEHVYAIELAAGVPVRITMRSSALDALLEIVDPDGETLRTDDTFAGSLDATVVLTPSVAGRFVVHATTARPRQTGAYTLRVERLDLATTTPLAPSAALDGRVFPVASDAVPGTWLRFDAQGGSRVRLRVTSTDFDPAVVVFAPGGEVWSNDDANETGEGGAERASDSTVNVSAPVSGSYLAVVTAFRHAGQGAFRVRASVTAPIVVHDGESVPAGGWAGAEGRGRVLGLFVGITAYHGGPLYGCADDARLLAKALRARHLIDEADSIVLTDAQATRSAFLGALERLSARARPEDIVLVFYSGHGNVQPAPAGSSELDGLDETLSLYDGPLVDTDLGAAFEPMHAGTIILALDSCHSGGFRDDFVTRPGRIGLFSSDADVLSDTAEPRRAGGYLSWYLRRGVLGEADAHPADGWLTAGELVDYVQAGFVRDDALLNPPGSDAPSQRLVADRGSVPHGQTLWAYPRPPSFALAPIPGLLLESAEPTSEAQPAAPDGGQCGR